MKKIVAFMALIFMSVLSFANEEVLTVVGKAPSGEDCTYQVMKMNDWEGQIVIYLNGEQGNFRVELNSQAFEKGVILSQFEASVDMTFIDGVLNVFVAGDDGDADRVIKITTEGGDILKPSSAIATQAPEEYNCRFN